MTKFWGFLLAALVSLALWAFVFVAIAQAATVEGTSHGDVLYGTVSSDQLYGWGGHDTLHGKRGNDILAAGAGADTLECGRGSDSAQANGGDDLIYCDATDGKADVIDCGSGNDIAFWRVAGTVLKRCEQVFHVSNSNDVAAE